MPESRQTIRGKDISDQIPGDQASRVRSARRTRAYQFKTYTLTGVEVDLDLSTRAADAPNALENLFSNFKRAHSIFVRTSADISIKLGENSDAIPILALNGGLYEEDRVEFEKVLLSGPNGAVIDVYIS